jgi:hypothetical protein
MITVTGLDKLAEERLQGLADMSITLNGVFNDGTNAAHDVFSTVPSSSVVRTVTLTISGQALPNEVFLHRLQSEPFGFSGTHVERPWSSRGWHSPDLGIMSR